MGCNYTFEEQMRLAEAWEAQNNVRLFRLSDWNTEADNVDLPVALIEKAFKYSLKALTIYSETALLVETSQQIQHNLASVYKTRFIDDAATHVFGNATQALFGIVYALKEVATNPVGLIIHPSYYSIQDAALMCGIPFLQMWRKKENQYIIDYDQIDWFRQKHSVNTLFLTDPVYSAGQTLSEAEWDDLLSYCRQYGLWVVIDGAFSGLSWRFPDRVWLDTRKLTRNGYDRAVIVDAPSKRLFTNNLKVGMVYANSQIVEKLHDFSDWFLGNITGIQIAFAGLLFSEEGKGVVEELCRNNANRAKLNFSALQSVIANSDKVSTLTPDGGFHALVFASGVPASSVDALQVCMQLVERYHTLAIPTNDFFHHPDDEFGIRINLTLSQRNWIPLLSELSRVGICP